METNLDLEDEPLAETAPMSLLFPSEKNFFLETAGSDLLWERFLAQLERGDSDLDGENHLEILESRFQAFRREHANNADLTNAARAEEADMRMDALLAALERYGIEEWELEEPMGATPQELLDAVYRFFVLGRRRRVLEWAWRKISSGFSDWAKERKAATGMDDHEVSAARAAVNTPAAALVLADLDRITAEIAGAPEIEEGKSALEELTGYDPSLYENQLVFSTLDGHFGPNELAEFLKPLAKGSDAREDMLLALRERFVEEHGK